MLADRYYQLLTAYVDGELDARQRKKVERLVAQSEEARALLEKLEGDSKELRESPRHAAPPTLSDLVMETVSHPTARPELPATPAAAVSGGAIPLWLGLALAACILMAVTVGTFFMVLGLRGKPDADVASPIKREQPAPKQPEQPPPPPELDPVVADLVAGAAQRFAEPVKDKDAGMRLVLSELYEEAVQKRLAHEMQNQSGLWLDVPVASTVKGLERVTDALLKNGFKILAKKDAKGAASKKYLLYVENVRPEELSRVLEQLAVGAPAARVAEQVLVKGMNKDDHQALATALQIPWKDVTPLKYGGTMVDIPMFVEKDRPLPKDQVGRAGKVLERFAVLLPLGDGNPATSPEVKQFLQERQAQNQGALQIVLVIHDKQAL
jgi:hypothetical protein